MLLVSLLRTPTLHWGWGDQAGGQVPMSFESKTVEPERSPIDSPCQNVEKSSSDDKLKSMPSWKEVWWAAQGGWVWYAEKGLVPGVLPSVRSIRDTRRGGRCGGVRARPMAECLNFRTWLRK